MGLGQTYRTEATAEASGNLGNPKETVDDLEHPRTRNVQSHTR